MISVTRKTTESEILVELDFERVHEDYRKDIQTPLTFINHMIEHIAWRGEFNIKIKTVLAQFELTHVICEDVGQTLGMAVAQQIIDNRQNGITGFGDGVGMIDEALAICAVSFEQRPYIDIDYGGVTVPDMTEGMAREDLETFLQGFVIGSGCGLHIMLHKGQNGHHIWEAIYRAFGLALKAALTINSKRAGMTSGVAGNIHYSIKSN